LNPSTRLGNTASTLERVEFLEYLNVNGYQENTVKDVIHYLDKFGVDVAGPQDVIHLFSKVKAAKRHMILALRILLNYCETIGYDKNYLDKLRNAIPKVRSGIDLKIPSEKEILDSLNKLEGALPKYAAVYNLLLDSGLRLVEGVTLINDFKEAEEINGFFRCNLAKFRGNKHAYYGHFSETTLEQIQNVNEKIGVRNAGHYFTKRGYTPSKYLRKFSFDKMIELEVPESVADFIQGRVPRRVGAKHYMALARQASKFYPRYLGYAENLRRG
jgi:intergrase/recombinase